MKNLLQSMSLLNNLYDLLSVCEEFLKILQEVSERRSRFLLNYEYLDVAKRYTYLPKTLISMMSMHSCHACENKPCGMTDCLNQHLKVCIK